MMIKEGHLAFKTHVTLPALIAGARSTFRGQPAWVPVPDTRHMRHGGLPAGSRTQLLPWLWSQSPVPAAQEGDT